MALFGVHGLVRQKCLTAPTSLETPGFVKNSNAVSDQRRARHVVHPVKSEETESWRKHSVRSRQVRRLSFGVILK
jgi:hypothetical protein